MNPSIKILVSYHKSCELYASECVKPIQVGTNLNGVIYENTLHDNSGVNISDKNKMYCELTAQYWAWKNFDADYLGFMHYRRYFSFNPARLDEDMYGNVNLECIDDSSINKLHLSDEKIRQTVSRYDLICTSSQDTKDLGQGANVYEHYKLSPHHRIEDFDTVLNIIEEKYPDYVSAAQRYIKDSKAYFCNMYIMKKSLFEDYSEWLFTILEEHEKRRDFSDYDINELRVSGFLAERLWGIYYTWLKENKNYKVREVQRSFFKDTDKDEEILPAFAENNIPIVVAADDKYVPYLTVMLRSLIENANKNKNYDVIILNSNISSHSKHAILNEFFTSSNLKIRFRNVAKQLSEYELFVHRHFTVEIYYRLLMQDIMKHYKKVIYLDSDMTILDDIAQLFDTQLDDHYMAVVQDVDSAGCYNGIDPERKEYFKKFMKMKDPYAYFNSGVLVMNLDKFREDFTSEEILDLSASKQWLFPDQDVLNILCEGNVIYLDMAWNVMMDWRSDTSCRLETAKKAPYWLNEKYLESRKHPKIAHYAGFQKPWEVPNCDFAEFFWQYARLTNVYETLLSKLVQTNCGTARNEKVASPIEADPYMLHINGLNEPLYIDGFYIKLINKLNKWFPKNSKKRTRMKKIARMFFR